MSRTKRHTDKMSQDKTSLGQNVTDKKSQDIMSLGQNVTEKMSHGQNVTRTKCHTEKM